MFLENGYQGLILDLPYADSKILEKVENRVDDEVNSLELLLRKELLSVPPIVIADSLPTFLIQKFLESYAITSLFMIDPISPNPVKFQSFYEKQLAQISEKTSPAIHLLYHDIITDKRQQVNLEANSLPMFVVLLGDNAEKEEVSKSFITYHGIDEEQILRLPASMSLNHLLDPSTNPETNQDHFKYY
eukprot:CAMPEP_0173135030 /NCGR_PEP_ID=MMETSP1105-20130129/1649_1 /TAXON_ID=2985 /ORGANISM="Ochromonas sp., Strain BG-1" /LENGTH=187 /DNA_ID=CAMNT_0014046951 /DNA_START=295 /DNA_END=858 /DNA_ORIENTATION=-